MAQSSIDHEAEVFIGQLWRDIYGRIRKIMHPHGYEHNPGGRDPLKLPLGSLADVDATAPADGEVLTYVAANTQWEPAAAAGGGGGAQQKTFCYAGTLALDSGGLKLTNNTGKTWTVSGIYAELGTAPGSGSVGITAHASAGSWSGTLTTTASSTGRSDSVADGTSLYVEITDIGTGTAAKDLAVTFVYTQAD